ncbi:MAG TPA: sensor histidine kinase [Polyangia bacterium]|jgi:signal transduction histidine kinase
MLTFAAFAAPPIVVATIVLRSGVWTRVDTLAIAGVGVVVPLCGLVRGPLAPRALLVLAVAFAVTYYFVGRNGLAGGLSVALITLTILASLVSSRSVGVACIILTLVAYLCVGLLAHRHDLTINAAASDPLIMRNWIRIGGVNALLALLLISVVEFVVRKVEASSRAATEALKWLRAAYDKLETTKEDERRFLSHELHDELGQTLTALKLRLQVAARAPAPQPADQESPLAQPLAIVDDLIARVRRISLDLRPPLLDEVGLVPALRAYLQSQAAVSGLTIALDATEPADETPRRLPADHEIACFRVVQEAITNVLRHAGARRVDVRIARSADRISLSIRDDGRGFDPETLDSSATRGHLGVPGMRERIEARGGRFRLTAAPGQGTTVEVDLDVPRSRAGG